MSSSQGVSKYEGNLKEGKRHGKGIETFPSGKKYEGQWRDGKRHGKGTLTYSDGQKYEGQWKNGLKHGKGTETSPDGSKYVGEFKDGQIYIHDEELDEGETDTISSSSKNEDENKDEKKNDQNIFPLIPTRKGSKISTQVVIALLIISSPFTVPPLVEYFNETDSPRTFSTMQSNKIKVLFSRSYFENGETKYGWFEKKYADSTGKYNGEVENGEPNGQGTFTGFESLYNYVGEFKDGHKNGQGTITNFFDNTKEVGEYRNELPWNTTLYDEEGNIAGKTVNGKIDKEVFNKYCEEAMNVVKEKINIYQFLSCYFGN